MLFFQILQVCKRQSREAAEQVKVSYQLHRLPFQFAVHQQVNLLSCQESTSHFHLWHLVVVEGVSRQPSVVYRPEHHCPQRQHIHGERIFAQMLVRAQKSLEVRDEGGRQLLERDIADMIAAEQELLQVSVYAFVFSERPL